MRIEFHWYGPLRHTCINPCDDKRSHLNGPHGVRFVRLVRLLAGISDRHSVSRAILINPSLPGTTSFLVSPHSNDSRARGRLISRPLMDSPMSTKRKQSNLDRQRKRSRWYKAPYQGIRSPHSWLQKTTPEVASGNQDHKQPEQARKWIVALHQ